MKKLHRIIRIFFLNPSLFFKKAVAYILLRIVPSPKDATASRVGGYTIVTWPSRNNWWKLMHIGYCGVEIAHNIKRYLNEGGVFIDVGGGIGYFSAIGSAIVGNSGQVHCFEPLPENIMAIRKMIESKPNSNIILNPYALSHNNETTSYYIERFENYTNSSMVEKLQDGGYASEVIRVKTRRLDEYLEKRGIKRIFLIKIDVEGYEYLVLKGLEGYFKSNADRPPIICEITPHACSMLGYTIGEFHDYMGDYGYQLHIKNY